MIRIKTFFRGWVEVDHDTALRWASNRFKSMTNVDNKTGYINEHLVDGVQFTEEQLKKG